MRGNVPPLPCRELPSTRHRHGLWLRIESPEAMHVILNSMTFLRALDIAFFVFHTGLILFILLGWIWRPLRRANLLVIVLTGLSWTALAPWYGFGYCPFTDWHWQVRIAMGDTDLPHSYMKFLLDNIFGTDFDPTLVSWVTILGLIAALCASVAVNVRDFVSKSREQAKKAEPPG